MKLITRDTDYALRALCVIAKRKDLVSVSELVKELKMPRPFLRKIMQVLNKKGVLESAKGRGGGFTLSGSAGKLSLLDIMGIFQGPMKLNECTFKKRICPNICSCCLKRKIDAFERKLAKELKLITLESLLRGEVDYAKKKDYTYR